jgi:hypothetical protein
LLPLVNISKERLGCSKKEKKEKKRERKKIKERGQMSH